MSSARQLRRSTWNNAAFFFLLAAIWVQVSCAHSAGGSGGGQSITVTVTPTSADVSLGATQQFQAIVTGSADTAVTWEVNGVRGGTAAAGTISASGLYTAPAVMPSPASVTVTAVSQANTQDTGSASVNLKDGLTISVAPNPVSIPTGGAQVFTATVTGSGDPASGLNWSVNRQLQ